MSKQPKRSRLPTATRDTVNWRVDSIVDPEIGVLAEADVARIAKVHALRPDSLRELSRRLPGIFRSDLSVDLKGSTVREITSDRRRVGHNRVKRANDLIRMALGKLSDASAQLEPVRFKDPYVHVGRPNPLNPRLEELGDVITRLREFGAFLETMERADLAVISGAPDARKVIDVRRTVLCTHLFNLWLDHDRQLTFTTDPETSERAGKLFDFINDVVLCLTDPPQKLNGETLKQELQAFKRGD